MAENKREVKEIVIPESRDFKGVWIYKNLYLSREYTPNEKFLLLEIYSLSNGVKKQCYANNKHFADFIGVKENTIQKAISKLEKNGHIVREYTYREGTKEISGRIITLTQKFYDDFVNETQVKEGPAEDNFEGVEKNPQGGGKKSTGGGGKKSIHKYNNNNISITDKSNTDYAFSESKDSSKVNIHAFVNESQEEPLELLEFFQEKYEEIFGKQCPMIKPSSIMQFWERYCNPPERLKGLEIEDYKELVMPYLKTDYTAISKSSKAITHSFEHFISGKIIENLYCKYLM